MNRLRAKRTDSFWFSALGVAEQAGVVGTIIGGMALLWMIYTHLLPQGSTTEQDPLLAEIAAGLTRQLEAKERDLRDSRQREEAARELAQSLREAIDAIPRQTAIPNAKARIQEALEAAAKGDTRLAEEIFSEVEARKTAEGTAANREAAEAARHLGALAFLHDTDKSIAAYRRATELDPENADGWNRLGHLLSRTGALDEAEAAYRVVASRGEATNDQGVLAVAYGNLGNLYQTRGDLDEAEAMYRKGLALNEALGRKEYMAAIYGNLGILYQTRGDLDQAEAMYKRALAIEEELGRKEGMASDYGNLGILRCPPGKREARGG